MRKGELPLLPGRRLLAAATSASAAEAVPAPGLSGFGPVAFFTMAPLRAAAFFSAVALAAAVLAAAAFLAAAVLAAAVLAATAWAASPRLWASSSAFFRASMAASVLGPTMPSTSRFCAFWNFLTAPQSSDRRARRWGRVDAEEGEGLLQDFHLQAARPSRSMTFTMRLLATANREPSVAESDPALLGRQPRRFRVE